MRRRWLRRLLWRLNIGRPFNHYLNHAGTIGCRCAAKGSPLWCYCHGPGHENCWRHVPTLEDAL